MAVQLLFLGVLRWLKNCAEKATIDLKTFSVREFAGPSGIFRRLKRDNSIDTLRIRPW